MATRHISLTLPPASKIYNLLLTGDYTLVDARANKEDYDRGHVRTAQHRPNYRVQDESRTMTYDDTVFASIVERFPFLIKSESPSAATAALEADNGWEAANRKKQQMLAMLKANSSPAVVDCNAPPPPPLPTATSLSANQRANKSKVENVFDKFVNLRNASSSTAALFMNPEEVPPDISLFYPSEVVPGFLFQGGLASAETLDVLADIGVTHIINTAAESVARYPERFNYLVIPVDDRPDNDLLSHFDKALAFIDDALSASDDSVVLVHCAQGISRSSTITLMYIMAKFGLSYEHAYQHLKRCRPFVQPNEGFRAQLQTWADRVSQ
jgi:protein-tyrosine phosphatase